MSNHRLRLVGADIVGCRISATGIAGHQSLQLGGRRPAARRPRLVAPARLVLALVHAGNGLAGGQSLAHGGDDLAVRDRPLFQCPGWHQVESGAHMGTGHHRVGAASVAASGLAVRAHQHREQRSTSENGPTGSRKQMFARCYAVRGKLSAVCQQRCHTWPHVAPRPPVR